MSGWGHSPVGALSRRGAGFIENPIFIVGTERSGSNLLRLILNSHSDVAVPHPPHIVHYFAPLEGRYGDLTQREPFRRLASDIHLLLRCHIYPWDVEIDIDEAMSRSPSRTAFGLCVALYEQYRVAKRKGRWACKSTFMVDHIETVLSHFPQAQIIFLVRDPRDVAVSARASVFSAYHPYRVARLWGRQQATGLHWLNRLPASTMRLVHYEHLVAQPETVVRQICSFLNVPFEPHMLEFFKTDEARRSASLAESWQNTGRPIATTGVGKYGKVLRPAATMLIERVVGETMRDLGYEPVTEYGANGGTVPVHARARYWLVEQALRVQVEMRSIRRDRNVWRRMMRGLLLAGLHVCR